MIIDLLTQNHSILGRNVGRNGLDSHVVCKVGKSQNSSCQQEIHTRGKWQLEIFARGFPISNQVGLATRQNGSTADTEIATRNFENFLGQVLACMTGHYQHTY
jgi:hypothetical protein